MKMEIVLAENEERCFSKGPAVKGESKAACNRINTKKVRCSCLKNRRTHAQSLHDGAKNRSLPSPAVGGVQVQPARDWLEDPQSAISKARILRARALPKPPQFKLPHHPGEARPSHTVRGRLRLFLFLFFYRRSVGVLHLCGERRARQRSEDLLFEGVLNLSLTNISHQDGMFY